VPIRNGNQNQEHLAYLSGLIPAQHEV
jgi:hypothetical protein